ncbi:MAG: FIG01019539: hypothetical protein [uncultured Cytophagales bacterium]|uniref:ASPIC/UnbV domain-containing protein n=1 Tax=uncultured Cytophagales bacterium TaxID=158755 RepID=A0A6J4JAL3_9SPHI|nr:MAG: FIG01019539: hypothetical protein [uncultured Cytophagales bacterium]
MRNFLFLAVLGAALLSCRQGADESPGRFRSVPAAETGIAFANKLRESWFHNYYNYAYFYNGGGVAAGDLDNDGLPELFFVSNQGPDKLYRNKGGLAFEDITARAGVGGDDRWDTGVTLADVNGDGWLDLYVCASGKERPNRRRNRLYVNNRNLTFTERAAELGLDDPGYSTQAAFFDYDRDGDLDCYLLNHPIAFNTSNDFLAAESKSPDAYESDKLYRNDGGRFADVTMEAGVRNYGYGLGVAVSDFNGDGWPDVYVANDFNTPDFLYLNARDGTFREASREALRHTANFGMGCDAADINNDGRPDLVELDMTPDDNRRRKISMPGMGAQAFRNTVEKGFGHQYMQNALQLNVPLPASPATPGPAPVAFAEIAELAGVARTDWSWSPLLADFDNDGHKDLYVSNGMRREVNNNDFTFYFRKERSEGKVDPTEYFRELNKMPVERVNKYAFRNGGDLRFRNVTGDWGLTNHHFTNGAAYGDLDGDGDLDLVLNNLDSVATVYENRRPAGPGGGFLRVQCRGAGGNPFGIGARVVLRYGGRTQHAEIATTRGFLSATEPVGHFGLGDAGKVDTLEVTWPGGKVSLLRDVAAGQVVVVPEAGAVVPGPPAPAPAGLLAEDPGALSPAFRHRENAHDDFAAQPLLPHGLSAAGPCLVAGDVNGDGYDDFYVGGAAGQSGALYLHAGGTFRAAGGPWAADAGSEDVGGTFFDADGDRDADLYVVSGGTEFPAGSPRLQDRLYLNDGKGHFTRSPDALPAERVNGACVAAGDFDGDGDADLFVGGASVAGRYPEAGRSFLLRNEGGRFTDVTAAVAPGLVQPGLVRAARWTDFDGDAAPDLLLAGEWMPVQLYRNGGGKLALWDAVRGAPATGAPGDGSVPHSIGWWGSVAEGDFDRDGDADYVLGNVGLNYPYQASPAVPFHLYAADFDDNGSVDPVLAYGQGGQVYPWRGRQALVEQLPALRRKYPDYASFATATVEAVFGREALAQARHYAATEFASVVLRNDGKGKFTKIPLPVPAQFSSVNGIATGDLNGDGHADLLLAGNHYGTESETRRNDAGYGLVLLGDGKGRFRPLSPSESGFFAPGDARGTVLLKTPQGGLVVVAHNDGTVQAFRTGRAAGRAVAVRESEP